MAVWAVVAFRLAKKHFTVQQAQLNFEICYPLSSCQTPGHPGTIQEANHRDCHADHYYQ